MRVTVHDSTGAFLVGEGSRRKRRKVKKHKHHAEFERLIDQLLNGPLTSDEAPGHPFHGNQYVEVAGQKVNVPTKGSVKEKLHHLFAQGHKFTLKELAALLGQSEVTLRGRLSEIKKAAPAGGMILEKTGEHYTLKKKEAEAGEVPLDKHGAPFESMEPWDGETLTHPEPEKASEPVASPTPAPAPVAAPVAPPEPVVEPPQTLAEKALPEPGEFKPPTTGKMEKAEADKIYQASQIKWFETVQSAGFPKDIEPETINALAQGFKNNKANGMAQWAANTTGNAQKAKPQQVFKADEQLIKDVLGGMDEVEALKLWKKNTAGEKAGTWPPDPFAEALALEQKIAAQAKAEAVTTALADATKAHAPLFDVVADYAGTHVPIGMEDFVGSSPVFQTEINKLKNKLYGGHTNSVGNKIEVQKGLEDRLAPSKAFQALVTQRKTGGHSYSLEAQLISAWAGSSGDHQPVPVANQLAIRDAFAMNPEHVATDALHLITKSKASEDEVYSQAASSLGCRFGTESERLTFKAGLRDFALAQYHATQDHFKQMGIEEVYVARGSAGHVGIAKEQGAATHGALKLQPASSFSANYATAAGSFSKGDSVYLTKVPASQVLSSYVTGFGCTSEHEVVVLAHPDMKAVRIGAYQGGSVGAAMSHIASTMKNAPEITLQMLAKMDEAKQKKVAAAHKEMLIHAKAGGPPPVVPKAIKYATKSFTNPAYKAAVKGDVEATKHAVAVFLEHKAKSGAKYQNTTPYMESIVKHAELVAAHKAAVAKAKAELKAEAKKQPKPKKTQVHVHVHEEPDYAMLAHKADQAKKAAAKTGMEGSKHPTQATIAQALEPTPAWYAEHPMHNETKYKAMVLAGKTPIQIKHYYGSLKHAAAKKQGAQA